MIKSTLVDERVAFENDNERVPFVIEVEPSQEPM